MAEYLEMKRKTSGRKSHKAFWRLCSQIAGSLGVFLLVTTIFQSTSPSSAAWQQWVRQSFTADADFAPVMQFFYQMDSPDTETAIRVNASAHPVQEAMAVPVNGKVLNSGTNEIQSDAMQLADRFEKGVWIAAEADEPVLAAYSGTVTGLWEEDGTSTVEVSHANGLITVYGSCAQSYVAINEPVKKGQPLGHTRQQEEEGNFYFAARYLGEPIDPLELLTEKTIVAR